MTFVRNHAQAILACDFFIVVTAHFLVLYVFVATEVGTRRMAHFNVTAHPTAEWTLQQFREVLTGERPYRFVLHDRDRIYSSELDSALGGQHLSSGYQVAARAILGGLHHEYRLEGSAA